MENGFQRMEAELFVTGEDAQATFFGAGTLFFEAEQVVPEKPDLTRLPAELRERVTFDPQTNTLAVSKALTEQDRAALEQCFSTPEGKRAVEAVFHLSHGRPAVAQTRPADRGPFRVPMLAIRWTASLNYLRKAISSIRLGDCRSVRPA